MREREAAVVALSQFKSDKGREMGDLNASLHRKDVEIRNLKKKCHDTEAKLKSVMSDFAASSTIHETEMKKMKAAHSKSLEMLMTYQEENDILRSAVSQLSTCLFPVKYQMASSFVPTDVRYAGKRW
jgi:hypothetical protein